MPKVKKQVVRKDSTSDSDSGPDDKNPPPSKKTKEDKADTKPGATNQWTLERLRQVRINEFRGRKMVDIREFYEKNGEVLPGKKGISLSLLQWKKLLEISAEVTAALDD